MLQTFTWITGLWTYAKLLGWFIWCFTKIWSFNVVTFSSSRNKVVKPSFNLLQYWWILKLWVKHVSIINYRLTGTLQFLSSLTINNIVLFFIILKVTELVSLDMVLSWTQIRYWQDRYNHLFLQECLYTLSEKTEEFSFCSPAFNPPEFASVQSMQRIELFSLLSWTMLHGQKTQFTLRF